MIIISSLRRSSLKCKHGKIVFFSSHKNEIGVLLLLHLIIDRNPHIFNCRKICRSGKNLVSSCPGVAFATPCHPMAIGLTESTFSSDTRQSMKRRMIAKQLTVPYIYRFVGKHS